MNTTAALNRTVLLCRYVVPHASAEAIVDALTTTTVAIVADASNLASGGCQSAVVTLAQLVMQMGCSVRLVGPDVSLCVEQPPWRGAKLTDVLRDMAADSVPGATFAIVDWPGDTDVVFAFGDAPCWAPRGWRLGATRWSGAIQPVEDRAARWTETFPIGGLAAATMAATETFKTSMRALGPSGAHVDELAPVRRATISLGDEVTPAPSDLGRVDCVSGGAIVQSTLHALRRVPLLFAAVRVIEPDLFDLTNLNRYALGRRLQVGELKTDLLASLSTPMFTISGEAVRFDEQSAPTLAPLAPRVIVGPDNVPSRWAVQREQPQWLVVGATSEFMAMTSEHDGSEGCAACAHPFDDGIRAKIPTVSFVSYWAGLMVAARVLRHAVGVASSESGEVSLIASLRLDLPFGAMRYANARSAHCPLSCSNARGA